MLNTSVRQKINSELRKVINSGMNPGDVDYTRMK